MFNLFSMCFGSKIDEYEYLPVYTESTEITEEPKSLNKPTSILENLITLENLGNPTNVLETKNNILTETSNEELKFMLEKMNKKINILDKNIRKIDKQMTVIKLQKNFNENTNNYHGNNSSTGTIVYTGGMAITKTLNESQSNSSEVKHEKYYTKKICDLLNIHESVKGVNNKFDSTINTFNVSFEFLEYKFYKKFYNTFLEKTEEHMVHLLLNEEQKSVMKTYNKKLINMNLTRFLKTKPLYSYTNYYTETPEWLTKQSEKHIHN